MDGRAYLAGYRSFRLNPQVELRAVRELPVTNSPLSSLSRPDAPRVPKRQAGRRLSASRTPLSILERLSFYGSFYVAFSAPPHLSSSRFCIRGRGYEPIMTHDIVATENRVGFVPTDI